TIVFEDEKPVDDFYTDDQEFIFMEIALRIDGTDWNYQKYLSRDGTGGSILLDGSNDAIKLDKQVDGSYQITIDPVSFFGPVTDGTTVDGFNIILFNQYHTDASATNNITSTLFIDLVDEEYNKTSISPSLPADDESVTITFDARGTALEGASTVYFHSGVATDVPGSTNFSIAVGNWGDDDGVGEMTIKTGTTNVWEITLTSITDYYLLPVQDNAFSLNYLFRSADGTLTEDNGGSNFNKELDPGNYFLIEAPALDPFLVQNGVDFNISATANASVDWVLEEIGDPDTEVETQSAQTTFSFDHSITSTSELEFRVSADFGTETRTKTFRVQGYEPINDAPVPAGATVGINYNESDDTEVTLVLHTPSSTDYKKGDGTVSGTGSTASKEVVHVIGDFNNWQISESYKMNRDGDYWWLTISDLTAGEDYVFQYLIDGDIRIGDPYADQVSDSEDQYISASVYPDLATYPSDKTSGRAAVINTLKTEYTWEVSSFTPVPTNELNIYELHFRDFTDEGTYAAAINKLDYLEELGINAIHVMPVSEFEGNSSWGYNPNYYFAADKAYGTPNDLKEFIDEAHKRDMAVFNDIVLNHAFGSNPMVLMYWDDDNNRPSTDNPWFNAEHKGIYSEAGHWGNDWNHESEHTQAFVDSVLSYWLNEFKFDGFRFDFTKGFTQTAPDSGDEWASTPDTDRQGLLQRMVDAMWDSKPGSVAIFEHLADASEDKVLA
ncbi:MAG: alpha-amylase family glycosyl hydrolase, partial [Marinoscillum sp.]